MIVELTVPQIVEHLESVVKASSTPPTGTVPVGFTHEQLQDAFANGVDEALSRQVWERAREVRDVPAPAVLLLAGVEGL